MKDFNLEKGFSGSYSGGAENETTEMRTSIKDAYTSNDVLRKVNSIRNSIEPIKQYSFLEENHNEILSQIKFGNTKSRTYSRKTQRWIGYVMNIREEIFEAKLIDVTNPGTYEIAEFLISKISPEDIGLFTKGAIFYWSVGDVMSNSQLKEETILRFQRQAWTENEVDEVADDAEELFNNINWNDFNK
jgi:hypothetical protein